MNIDDHLDALNDIVLEHSNKKDAEHEVRRYCEENDLCTVGFQVHVDFESVHDEHIIYVEIAK